MSSQRRQFHPPHLPLQGGILPSRLAGAPTSTRTGHLASEAGPAGGERRVLGTALPVTVCGAVLPNQEQAGHLHYPSLGAPGGLAKGTNPLLGQDTKGPVPVGSVQIQVAASRAGQESSPGARARNDHPSPWDPCHPFPKRAVMSPSPPSRTTGSEQVRGAGVGGGAGVGMGFLFTVVAGIFSLLFPHCRSEHPPPSRPASVSTLIQGASRGGGDFAEKTFSNCHRFPPPPAAALPLLLFPPLTDGGMLSFGAPRTAGGIWAQLRAGRRASSSAHLPGIPSFAVTPLR